MQKESVARETNTWKFLISRLIKDEESKGIKKRVKLKKIFQPILLENQKGKWVVVVWGKLGKA